MAELAEPEFVAGTLAWCNEMRAKKDRPPLDRLPKGTRDDPWTCPCGRATGLYVDRDRFGDDGDAGTPHDLPGPVIDFVRAFDAGELPQYDVLALEG